MKKIRPVPALIAIASLVLMLVGVRLYIGFVNDVRITEGKSNLRDRLFLLKSNLEKSLYSRIYYTKSVAAYVSMNPDITREEYDRLAGGFVEGDSVISTMALSRNCIISAIYPLEGHESALGLDLLAHPKRKEIVEQTVRTHKTFIAGPVELVEGGIAFISYTPIFLQAAASGDRKFWGVTDIVIRRDRLFHEAGLKFNDSEFRYGLRGYDGRGASGSVIWGDSAVFSLDPVCVEVNLPTGSWVLGAVPVTSWGDLLKQTDRIGLLLTLVAVFIAVLIWIIAIALFRIRTNAREFAAMFGAMDDLIIEFSSKGDYLQIAPTNDSLLVRPKSMMLGKNVYDILEKPVADLHYQAIRQCLAEKSQVVIEYSVKLGEEIRWFQGRFSYMTDYSVIFMAEDISRKKSDEESLRNSEQLLRELNDTKDKIFSVIAHDLRNPLTAFLGLSEIIAAETSNLSPDEVRVMAGRMRKSAYNLLGQIEDLLEWSQLQQGIVQFCPEKIPLDKLVVICVEEMSEMARKKEIRIDTQLENALEIAGDRRMIKSVVSNLLSNSVKFTRTGGWVHVSASRIAGDQVRLVVKDSGIGMNREILSGLFTMDLHINRKGTDGEPSTGLGLILCKEFVDKHNGMIWAESEVGEGSTFFVTLPAGT